MFHHQDQIQEILNLSFPKSMKWGTNKMRFARPIKWILALADRELVNFEVEGLKTELAKYQSVKVDLTELAMDYSFRISPIVMGSGIERAIEGQIELKNAQVAKNIDIYGFNKLNSDITGPADGSMAYTDGQITKWAPSNGTETIELINDLKSKFSS